MVLWVVTLLSIVAAGYVVVARTEVLQARHVFDTSRARHYAEAGLNIAAFELRNPDAEARWFVDGRPYQLRLDDVELSIRIVDESGKVDINVVGEELLQSLFIAAGVEDTQALSLAQAIVDWRDADDDAGLYGAEIDVYEAEGYPYVPKNAPFDTVEELQLVYGMSYELYEQVEPAITVYTGRAAVNPAVAPELVLAALPDIDLGTVDELLAAREAGPEGNASDIDALGVGGARGSSTVFTVRADAELDNGVRDTIRATIRLQGGRPGERAFSILRWQQGAAAAEEGSQPLTEQSE
jgi:general secretion pathway protein K